MSSIDVILISNFNNMLALPYLTEHYGFNGLILATEPTLQIGRQLMKELVLYTKHISSLSPTVNGVPFWQSKAALGNLSKELFESLPQDAMFWKSLYNKHDIASSLTKVRPISYKEIIKITDDIQVIPTSAGYSLGSTNWIIQTPFEKISYVSRSSIHPQHMMAMDSDAPNNSDVIILSDLADCLSLPLPSPDSQIDNLCNSIGVTVSSGGNVLIPASPAGAIFELLDTIVSYLNSVGLYNVPVYIVNPVAGSLLSYSNIVAEWVSSARQERVYQPEPPFAHSTHLKQGRVKQFKSLNVTNFSSAFRSPAVVFAGHPSLRFGEALDLLNSWKHDKKNSLILIVQFRYLREVDPEYGLKQILAVHSGIQMHVNHIPIDWRLQSGSRDLDKLVQKWKPKNILVPSAHFDRCNFEAKSLAKCALPYSTLSEIHVPLHRHHEYCEISAELSGTITPIPVHDKLVSHFEGYLRLYNGQYFLTSAREGEKGKERERGRGRGRGRVEAESETQLGVGGVGEKKDIWGAPNWERIYSTLLKLENVGKIEAEPQVDPNVITFVLASLNSKITFHQSKTIIESNDSLLRKKLADIILEDLY